MKCASCNTTWSDDRKFTKCPVCGENLADEKQIITDPIEFISFLLGKYGKDIFYYPQRCVSATKDLFCGDIVTSYLLKTAFESEVYKELFKSQNADYETKKSYIKKAVNKLSEDYSISKDRAIVSVRWFVRTINYLPYSDFVKIDLDTEFLTDKQKLEIIRSLFRTNYSVKNIKSSYIPGEEDFFESIINDVKTKDPHLTQMDLFDSLDFNYTNHYLADMIRFAKERYKEMKKGIKYCKKKDRGDSKTSNNVKYETFENKQEIAPDKIKMPQRNTLGIKKTVSNNQNERNNIFIVEELNLEMIKCPSGTFMMGSPQDELGRYSNELSHKVIITKPFYIGKYPITQYQYQFLTNNNSSMFQNNLNPVENRTWNEAKEFCEKLNRFSNNIPQGYKFDLPTEAQWEYACRAGSVSALYNGKELITQDGFDSNLDEIAWYDKNSSGITHPVGQKKPNAWGIYDMLGNVYEWCQDIYDNYTSLIDTDPKGGKKTPYHKSTYVMRGGSVFAKARDCRSSNRKVFFGNSFPIIGFRVALVPTD